MNSSSTSKRVKPPYFGSSMLVGSVGGVCLLSFIVPSSGEAIVGNDYDQLLEW